MIYSSAKTLVLVLRGRIKIRRFNLSLKPFRIRREVLLTSFYVTHVSILSSDTSYRNFSIYKNSLQNVLLPLEKKIFFSSSLLRYIA